MSRAFRAAAVAGVLLAGLGGCGGGDRVFEPEELITELNGAGAEIKLGPVLTTNPQGLDVISIFVADPAGQGDLGAGTMVLYGDSGAAREEFARCEVAPALTCYRAANGVLRFEEILPAGQTQVETAVRAIETEG